MAEVYKGRYEPIKTILFWNGENVDADNAVTVTFYDITEDPSIIPPINPATPIATLVATKIETNIGSYQVTLPTNLTDREKKLKLIWTYQVGGVSASNTTYAEVVVPYASIADAIEILEIGIDSSDPNYKTYSQLKLAEKYGRHLIENFTGQEFHDYDDTEIVYGTGTNILPVSYRIQEIYKLYADDVLLYDATTSPVTNNWLYTPIIDESHYAIRVNTSSFIDNTVYVANGMVPPSIYGSANGVFMKDVRYKIVAKFGWDEVPEDVQQACINLMGHYFEKDRIWKDQYVKSLQTFDWSIQYSTEVFATTGCAYADRLLTPYVLSKMVVI